MANYTVNITDGVGSQNMKNGNYSVSVSVSGYDATTLSPSSYQVSDSQGTGNFTVSADGTLTLIFNETGASGGTPVTSGSVVMTDSQGQTQYGSPVTISNEGNAVFSNVPYDASSPYVLYFKQLSTDDGHNVDPNVITVNMSSASQTAYVLNTAIALQQFTLTDANYPGLNVAAATLTFTGE